MSSLKILGNRLCYGKKKFQANITFKALYSSHLGEVMAPSLLFNYH